jgi:hypothetical protein
MVTSCIAASRGPDERGAARAAGDPGKFFLVQHCSSVGSLASIRLSFTAHEVDVIVQNLACSSPMASLSDKGFDARALLTEISGAYFTSDELFGVVYNAALVAWGADTEPVTTEEYHTIMAAVAAFFECILANKDAQLLRGMIGCIDAHKATLLQSCQLDQAPCPRTRMCLPTE